MHFFKNMTASKFILSFIAAICVPTFLLTLLVQVNFIDTLYDQTKDELCESVEYLKDDVDRQYQNFTDVVNYFYMDDTFRVPEKPYDYFKYIEIRDKIYYMTYSNPLIEECAVFFPNHDYIMSGNSTYKLRYFLSKYEIEGFDEESFYNYLIDPEKNDILYTSDAGSRNVLYIYPTFDADGSHLHTVIFITSDVSHRLMIRNSVDSTTGCVYIRDDNGELISYINNDNERDVTFYSSHDFYESAGKSGKGIEYEDAFITTLHSDYSSLTYNLVVRESAVADSILHLRYMWIGIILAVTFISIAIAVIVAKMNYRPIRDLKSQAQEIYGSSDKRIDDYHYLSETMEYMNHQNELLQNSLDDINEYVVFKILTGQYSSDSEINRIGQLISVPMGSTLMRVLLVRDMKNRGYRALYKTCLDILPEKVHFLIRKEEHDDRYAIILIYDLTSLGDTELLLPEFDESYKVAYGGLQKSARWVALSYAEAYFNMTSVFEEPSSLASALLTEGFDSAKYHLEKCIEYIETASLPESILICLKVTLTIADAYRKLSPETNLFKLPDVMTLIALKNREQVINLLQTEMMPLVDKLAVRETHTYQDSFVEMKKYIKEHYRDIDFSFQQMADSFGVSLTVLSRRFSEYSGVSLIDYTTDLKINMAKEMLCNTDMSINEIGMEVGYYSSNSFIRRFKQMTGVSPGEYRKANKGSESEQE